VAGRNIGEKRQCQATGMALNDGIGSQLAKARSSAWRKWRHQLNNNQAWRQRSGISGISISNGS